MSPEECISALDRALAEDGEDIILRRTTGATISSNADVVVRAFVRAFKPEELVGTISQTDSLVTISPTEIVRAKWPGAQLVPAVTPPFATDPRIPKLNDKAIIQGRPRNVSFSKPILMDGVWVRCELTVAG